MEIPDCYRWMTLSLRKGEQVPLAENRQVYAGPKQQKSPRNRAVSGRFCQILFSYLFPGVSAQRPYITEHSAGTVSVPHPAWG